MLQNSEQIRNGKSPFMKKENTHGFNGVNRFVLWLYSCEFKTHEFKNPYVPDPIVLNQIYRSICNKKLTLSCSCSN